jgi:hypothetical protein
MRQEHAAYAAPENQRVSDCLKGIQLLEKQLTLN